MNQPVCPRCRHVLGWSGALRQVLGPSGRASSLWGARCPACDADLKVPNARVLLIVALAIFFGSQTSTLLLLGAPGRLEFWLAKLGLILGYYVIAVFFFFKLEPVA